MKHVVFLLAIILIGIGVLISSLTLYPFLEFGFSSIANEYPNSKVYILSVILDNSGMPSNFEIIGMDLTAQNLLVIKVPTNLEIDGGTISSVYQAMGIKEVEKRLEKKIKVRFTDYFVMTKSAFENYTGTSNYSMEDFLKVTEEKVKKINFLDLFSLFNSFSDSFKSSINLTKYIRISRFLETDPVIASINYPSGTLNDIEEQNFSIELENCVPIYNAFSIRPVIINCTDEPSTTFYQNNWNRWSKNAYNFSIIPDQFSLISGTSVVISISHANWKLLAIKKALSTIYPTRKFEFLNVSDQKTLSLYYMIDNWASSLRYYDIEKYDFVILLGSS
uniref:LytR family transcriptional regulator n=1 Tax=Mesoaciditoga lauensis TaxID=1495039 RepID=A0A7V3VSR5_9BACT